MDSANNMTSVLKRKRAPVEVLDTPKRSKSVKTQSGTPLRNVIQNSGWDAAFNPPPATELVRTKMTNGDGKALNGRLHSPDSVEYETFIKEESKVNGVKQEDSTAKSTKSARGHKNTDKKRKSSQNTPNSNSNLVPIPSAIKKTGLEPWKLSAAIGGRMVNADPVFTQDEKYD